MALRRSASMRGRIIPAAVPQHRVRRDSSHALLAFNSPNDSSALVDDEDRMAAGIRKRLDLLRVVRREVHADIPFVVLDSCGERTQGHGLALALHLTLGY